MRNIVILLILFSSFFLSSFAMCADYDVTNIKTKIATRPDSSGDIWFAIKATVTNNSESDQVRVSLQAVDREGFELKDITLGGTVRPGHKKILTDKTYMPYKEYKQIKKWQVSD